MDIRIAGYVPGALGRVAELHARYYAEHWGFGLFFEAKVAAGLAEFLPRLDPARDGFWTLVADGRVEGAVAIDGSRAEADGATGGATGGAHLRWFILSDALRGRGLGDRLLDAALDFCRSAGHPSVFLWTFRGLDAARHLYEKRGFRLAEETSGRQWGVVVREQRFVLNLA
jgi:GNAT superfamily N-acetyltransferase